MLKTIKNGIYQHYKKLPYQVLGVVQHSETLEYMVYYQALYGERGFWVRPLNIFIEEVIVDGIKQPRFMYLHSIT